MNLKIIRLTHLARRALEQIVRGQLDVGERGDDGLVEVLLLEEFAEVLESRAAERGISVSDFIVNFYQELKDARAQNA